MFITMRRQTHNAAAVTVARISAVLYGVGFPRVKSEIMRNTMGFSERSRLSQIEP